MASEFNQAANDSPRSGGSKRMTPLIWAAVIVAAIAVVLWLKLHA